MKGNSGRKLMAMILFLVLPAALLATVSVRSTTADTVVSTVAVGSGPCAVAVNPVTNKIYIVNNDNIRCTATVIDGATNSTTTVSVGQSPGAIAVNPVTNKVYVVNNSNAYGENATMGTVTVIDGATNQSATVAVGLNPITLAVNPATNMVYVLNNSDDGDTVTVIDGATNSTATINVGPDPGAIAVNPVSNKIYVVNSNVYFTNSNNDINNGGHTGSVTVIDGADNSTATVNAGSYPLAIAVNSATNKVYVVNNSNAYGENATMGTVTVIDGATNSTATINVGPDPGAIAVNPVSNKIYVVNCGQGPGDTTPNWDGTVTVIDGTDNSTTTVPLGLHPNAVAVNPFTGQAYVANEGDNTVTVIDGAAASEVQKSISFTVGQNSYTANGQSLAMDAAPLIAGGRLLAPVRYLADALGAQTTWDATRRTVSILRGNTALELAISSAALNDNGRVGWMDTAPVIINGRTYFPIRYIAEAFGYTVSWDASSQTVTVSQGN
jgi:DNA-binding beta-propeller fold protein YncE